MIGLLALILEKRMFIMDDMEFTGKKQSLGNAFLSLNQIKFVSNLMNRIAYELFEDDNKGVTYGSFLLTNIKESLSRLVCRD